MEGNNKHILSTRLLKGEKVKEAKRAGLIIEQRSFIETVPVKEESIRTQLEGLSAKNNCIVFTSAAAVKAVDAYGLQPGEMRIYCTAPATSDIVTTVFGKEWIRGTAANASDLAKLIAKEKSCQHVIFFCGKEHREELPYILRENGIEVKEVIVYDTVMKPQLIANDPDGILFFSPSAVKSFFMKNQCGEKTVLFAIGETTAGELRKYSQNELMVAAQPSEDTLLQMVIDRFTKQ